MPVYYPYSFAAVHVEWRGGNNDEPLEDPLRGKLRDIEDEALSSLDIHPGMVRRAPAPRGSLLAWPGYVPPQAIASLFVDALCEGLRDHAMRSPAEPIRIRLALNTGESSGDDLWSSRPATGAAALADSPVVRRVLAASVGSPLVLIVSDEWHTAARALYGYQPVVVAETGLSGPAWIKVPGNSWPPGLRPDDTWAPPRIATPAAGHRHPAAGRFFHGAPAGRPFRKA